MDFDTKIADGFRNKKGIFDPKNVKERAKICRRWLREQKESVIVGMSFLLREFGVKVADEVVVAHADILRCIVDRTDQENKSERVSLPVQEQLNEKLISQEWNNCEAKAFIFESMDDEDAVLIQTEEDRWIGPEIKTG
jgi:hypothetical protein